MAFSNLHLYFLLINKFILLLVSAKNETNTSLYTKNQTVVHVGVILDFRSSTGFVANSCISTAIPDFYTKSPHYSTRLVLHPKNSKNLLTAASAVLELVDEDQVDAIIGPQYPNETRIVAEIGRISQVPIISFFMTGSSLWPTQTPYFIQTKPPESSQLKGITSLIKQLGWHASVVLYQDDTDDESGYGFISSLTDAFQKASIQLSYVIAISSSVNISHIRKELNHLRTMQTRVFLVHVTSPTLASRLFYLANEVGIMSNQTAWIITDALSKTLSSLDATTIESMEGVLGIRHYIPSSEKLENLKNRWNENELDICLRAYDTVWALATAVEKIQFPEVNRSHKTLNASSHAIPSLGISEVGPRLVKEILETRFLGASGEFKLKDGQLASAAFEIINVVGNGGRTVGYWTPRRGFSRKIVSAYENDHGAVYSKRLDRVLKPIIWPGDSTTKPKGWDVPGMGQKLKVGDPRRTGFTGFVNVQEIGDTKKYNNVQEIGDTKKYNVTGFCIDVFQAALDSLSFKLEPEYFPILVVDNGRTFGTNDDPSGTKTPDYDVVVGDITIRADREEKVDFSLPYLESGVVMVVRAEPDRLKNMWIFLKPLSWDLWLMIALAAIFTGLVLQMLERHVNPQRQLRMLFLFPLAALAFPEKNMVQNNWARFVLVVWLFMAYILMQSYTANLSSILTVAQAKNFGRYPCLCRLSRSYKSIEAYNEALSLGCKKGGVDAIFDEIPYIKLFIHKYGSRYKIVGPTYRTGGFGFAFPTGSPLSKPVSKAILDVMEKGIIQDIEKRYFGVGYTSQYHDDEISRDGPSLTSYSFAGLFTSTAFLTLLALGCSECSFAISRWRKQKVTNVSRVPFVEMAHDIPPEIDQKDSEDVIIIGQEEGDQQEVLPEPKNIDNHHRDG